MRIGYPCINTSIGCTSSRTFRLKSYSPKRLEETVKINLACLERVLRFNQKHQILFFRITSDLVPFASHPICKYDWQGSFETRFKTLGNFIRNCGMRISMHPDQFTLINSLDKKVFENSARELGYHAQVLDLLALDASAKIQIHAGGIYGDKETSMRRFVKRFDMLDERVKRRLVLENDDSRYNLKECLKISVEVGIPLLFDVLHHEVNNSGENIREAFELFVPTWKYDDGLPMVDYSSPMIDDRKGKHAGTLDLKIFRELLEETKPFDFDIMLEIKDKEMSALKAIEIASQDDRFSVAEKHTS
ncbi:MAG: UV DNA damage repair endonuclease UvsE [Candidatus Bathyarchaeota archaeon]|nr:MAG: UV DNA damage repair endonuclease UvsE [Candidatus Bathyarchaeota archaeon]